MQDIPLHNYSQYSNKTVNWVGTDQPQGVETIKSDPSRYQQWLDSGWNESTIIEYKFNEHGFRTDSFDQSPRLAIFGSSQIVGVGIHNYQTWTQCLSKTLDVPVWNLATGTGCLDTCYRMIKYYVDNLNIKAIILAVPEDNKFEFWENSNIPSIVNGAEKYQSQDLINLYKMMYRYPNNVLAREKNLLAIKYICNQKNIPLATFHISDASAYKQVDPVDWSRCMSHIGPRCHKNIAEFVIEKLWPTLNTPWH